MTQPDQRYSCKLIETNLPISVVNAVMYFALFHPINNEMV